MLLLILYIVVIIAWASAHIVLHIIWDQRTLSVAQIRLCEHSLQIIFVAAAALFEFKARPALAAEYEVLELPIAPWVLIYGLPACAIFLFAIICVAVDLIRTYRTKKYLGFTSCSFWGGLAIIIAIPAIVAQAMANSGLRLG
jgi:hypothetical protein